MGNIAQRDAGRITIRIGETQSSGVSSAPEIMSRAPVFRRTRVPVQSLFEHLEDNMSLDKFLEYFPTVRREDAVAVLEHSKTEILAEAHA